MIEITDSNYNNGKILKSKETMVVKVSASWCGPCKAYKPIFEQFAQKNENDKIGFAEADADENEDLVNSFKVRGVPCTLIFKNGILVNKENGNISEERLSELIYTTH